MRLMGLDVGTKRIGVAVSDERAVIARGLTTIERRGLTEDLEALARLIDEYGISQTVVGLPRDLKGTVGPGARKVLEFVDALRERVTVPVVVWDERLTTVVAEKALIEGGVSRRKRKGMRDRVAAVLILQNYMDARKVLVGNATAG